MEISSKRIEFEEPLTITVANKKGGVGKTSIVRILAFVLSILEYKVLVVDTDDSGNLTKSLLITKNIYSEEENDDLVIEKTMMAGIEERDLTDLAIKIKDNLYCVPSYGDLENLPDQLTKWYGSARKKDPNYVEVKSKKIRVLKDLIEPMKKDYDFIIIDSPPTAGDFVNNAVFASDYLVVAFQTQEDSLDGAINFIEKDLVEMIEVFDAETEVVGVLPNQMSQGAIDREVVADAIEVFGEQNMFKNILPFVKKIQSMPKYGISVEGYWEKKALDEVYLPFVLEFLERLAIFEGVEINE